MLIRYKLSAMSETPLYPLLFKPIYQYRLWGGRRLANLLAEPLPDGPVGEAWILSDREDHASEVINGGLKGKTLPELFKHEQKALMGIYANMFDRFPLLLKFLDAREVLSIQVHPSDDQKKYIPKGDTGKTEAWIVLETGAKSLIYAGLEPGTDEATLRKALDENKVDKYVHCFTPKIGDGIFIHSGTVHTLADVVVFEIQENSDTTYRLYDWNRIDERTGKPRELQIDKAIACIDFGITNVRPVTPIIESSALVKREEYFNNEHFVLECIHTVLKFDIATKNEPRILVCTHGIAQVKYGNEICPLKRGDVMLLPASVSSVTILPQGEITLLQAIIPSKTN
jgi:mannose-6-phosphate isomerase